LRSFQYALEGIKQVLITQHNARIHAGFTLAVFLLGFVVNLSRFEWIALVLTVGLVWTAELFNTALEVMVDIVSPEQHPAAKICKDISAGGVLMSVIVSVLVGLLLFGPPLWRWIAGFSQ
jgi:diacylglycerol kinase